jgi:UPF0755 protein
MRFFLFTSIFLLVFGFTFLSSIYLKINFFDSSLAASPVTFRIDQNENISSISTRLKEKKLIISSQLFEYGARYKKLDKSIRYGEFILTDNMSIIDVLKIITSNQALNYNIVIRDCMTNWEIIKLFEQKYFLSNDLVNFDLNEGSFAPNTYNISYNSKFSELLQLMQRDQTKILSEEWTGRREELSIKNPSELLVLASIIEKEAASIAEMPLISSVFNNRLNIGMRLQSDPTVNYGLDFGNIDKRKILTKKDLRDANAHNTYRISGLPASPICNPSKNAINAAANPAVTKYFYFVLGESGKHIFSKTFEEHINNVLLWRKSRE